MARKLRIAVSVCFGLLTVALVVMWVRSYGINEGFSKSANGTLTGFGSNGGWLYCQHIKSLSRNPTGYGWRYSAIETSDLMQLRRWSFRPRNMSLYVPHSGLTAISAGIAWIALVRPRFSLRTLLIATTLVAVVLGWIVWMVR